MKILLVEDNPGDILLAKEALRINAPAENAYELTIVNDGEAAIQYLYGELPMQAFERPDLILLDLNLPRKGGLEVLKQVKQDENLQTIPVIIFSTSASESDIQDSYTYHANCYITKPVDFNEFVKVMGSILSYCQEALPPIKVAA